MAVVITLSVMGTIWACGMIALFCLYISVPIGEPLGPRDIIEIVFWPLTIMYALVSWGEWRKQHENKGE